MEISWNEELTKAMKLAGDAGPVIAKYPDEKSFQILFDSSDLMSPDVTAWTEKYVYSSCTGYDESNYMASALRNPPI